MILLFCACILNVSSQYYLRGTVHDESGRGLYNVRINLFSKGTLPYYTGTTGAFGIPTNLAVDTITLQAEGYETLKCPVQSAQFQSLTLKMLTVIANQKKHRLASLTKDRASMQHDVVHYHGGETYLTLIENDFVPAERYPQTGFSMNVDRASYSNVRRFLNNNGKVPQDAVRIEEMLNYFSFPNNNNAADSFTCKATLASCPWNRSNQLLFINLQAPVIKVDNIPPTNLIFLIDVSGSMEEANRLPLLKGAFKQLVANLRAQDSVGIVIYGGGVGIWLQPTSGSNKKEINDAIDRLEAGGETPGAAAIATAYGLAEQVFGRNANNRVILATDGDFNVGQNTEKELEYLISEHRKSGIYLTCIGVGMGNYKDSKLEALAKMGNGNFAYVDNRNEAEKVLITEFTKTLYAVALECHAGVTFNPALVKKYRLIGFDNNIDAITDTTSQLEGGEIGTGHALMAVFEIEPVGSNTDSTVGSFTNSNIASVNMQYRLPQQPAEKKQVFEVANQPLDIIQADSSLRFAAAVIMFGELLKQSPFADSYTWDDVIAMGKAAANKQNYPQAEFLTLAEAAKKIYALGKKKKNED